MLGTMAMLDANKHEGLIFGTGSIAGSGSGTTLLRSTATHTCGWDMVQRLPPRCTHSVITLRPCYAGTKNRAHRAPRHFVGDMPHNWASTNSSGWCDIS